jgi:hypothetical protein
MMPKWMAALEKRMEQRKNDEIRMALEQALELYDLNRPVHPSREFPKTVARARKALGAPAPKELEK